MTPPRVAVGPFPSEFATDAVRDGGGEVVELGDRPDSLVWLDPGDVDGLAGWLAEVPDARWVQLPFAGVERVAAGGTARRRADLDLRQGRLRRAGGRARTGPGPGGPAPPADPGGGPVLGHPGRDQPVRPEGDHPGRRRHRHVAAGAAGPVPGGGDGGAPPVADPVPGAARVLPVDRLHEALVDPLVVVLALALTPRPSGSSAPPSWTPCPTSAWLVNVARGRHVDTDALVDALSARSIAGAALDVTDPEPLPDGHALWDLDNCIVTPHTADTIEMVIPLLAARIRTNVRRLVGGEPLVGLVDAAAGY